jgi:hypothetical protein
MSVLDLVVALATVSLFTYLLYALLRAEHL